MGFRQWSSMNINDLVASDFPWDVSSCFFAEIHQIQGRVASASSWGGAGCCGRTSSCGSSRPEPCVCWGYPWSQGLSYESLLNHPVKSVNKQTNTFCHFGVHPFDPYPRLTSNLPGSCHLSEKHGGEHSTCGKSSSRSWTFGQAPWGNPPMFQLSMNPGECIIKKGWEGSEHVRPLASCKCSHQSNLMTCTVFRFSGFFSTFSHQGSAKEGSMTPPRRRNTKCNVNSWDTNADPNDIPWRKASVRPSPSECCSLKGCGHPPTSTFAESHRPSSSSSSSSPRKAMFEGCYVYHPQSW